ncbi:hypothetical protein RP20_CCG024452 [Aedes albopictus]|nr:hypothetical protein RP20_CCG024452 [Aedes albopictus]
MIKNCYKELPEVANMTPEEVRCGQAVYADSKPMQTFKQTTKGEGGSEVKGGVEIVIETPGRLPT